MMAVTMDVMLVVLAVMKADKMVAMMDVMMDAIKAEKLVVMLVLRMAGTMVVMMAV